MSIAVTSDQLRAWFAHSLAPDEQTGNVSMVVELAGCVPVEPLRQAVSAALAAHPELLTGYLDEPDGILRRAAPVRPDSPGAPDVTVLDLREAPGTAEQALAAYAAQPIGAATGPLVRALVLLAPGRSQLALTAHPVGCDEVSLGRLLDEIGHRYAALTGLRPGPAAVPPGPVDDGPDWAELGPALQQERLDYWASRLAGLTPVELPADRVRPAGPAGRTESCSRQLTATLSRALAEFGGHTPAAAVLAAFLTVLARYTGRCELAVTATASVAGGPLRPVDPVVLPIALDDGLGFADLVHEAAEAWREAVACRAPLLPIATRCGTGRGHEPPTRVAFTAIAAGGGWPVELTARAALGPPRSLLTDLDLRVVTGPQGCRLDLAFAADLFDRDRAERMLEHLEQLLRYVVAHPDVSVHAAPLLSEAERDRLLTQWQGPHRPAGPELVHQMFARTALAHPGLVAVRMDGLDTTYGELYRRSGAIACQLRALGVTAGEIVGIAVRRGPAAFEAIFGVLRAGAAFVVIEPGHPAGRQQFVLQDSGARFVLTTAEVRPLLPGADGWAPVLIDDLPAGSSEPLAEWADSDSLAYVLYTSGSTGRPKGVMIEHGALVHYPRWLAEVFDLGPDDRMLQHMALSFDFSEGEMFAAASCGATMVVAPDRVRASPEAMTALLRDERVTYIGGPPPLLARLPAADLPELRYLLTGGDLLHPDLVNRWQAPHRRFVNAYGPTEAAIGSTWFECGPDTWSTRPPIGRPMPNRYLYVADRWGNLAPTGVPGELLLGGAGVGAGYLNRPELSAERFVADPYRPSGRVYRSGDLACWNADGQLEFLGRIDSQVKVNGARVEVEEIESVLLEHPAVAQAAVLVQRGPSADQLVAYLVVVDGPAPTRSELRSHLAGLMPGYMVPARFVVLEDMPLTSAGKIDRAALPGPADADAGATVAESALTRQVAAAFATVLERPGIDPEADFFAAGGDPAAALRLVAMLNQTPDGRQLTLRSFCALPTVTGVVSALQPVSGQAWDDDLLDLLTEVEQMTDEQVRWDLHAGEVGDSAR